VLTLDLANQLKAKFGDLISEPTEFRGEITVKLADAEQIAEVCGFAKAKLGFEYLVDISSVDNYGEDPRWTVVYDLRSLSNNAELRIKTDVSEEKSELPSVLGVWRSTNWHEREIYDMMGIRFRGHPDLRRILMWPEFTDHPMRKDYVEPDDYEYEPTPHDDVLAKARQHYLKVLDLDPRNPQATDIRFWLLANPS